MHEPLPSVIILVNGEILVSELEKINKSKEWLETELKKQNVNDSQEVFLAEYWNNKVKFVLKSNKA